MSRIQTVTTAYAVITFMRDQGNELTKGVPLLNRNLCCISCGAKSQRTGKSWELWNQCSNCAKKNNPHYSSALKCIECNATSNNTTAYCWKYNKCGRCFYKKDETRRHVLCPKCEIVAYKLSYEKMGRKAIKLFYCHECTRIMNIHSEIIYQIKDIEVTHD